MKKIVLLALFGMATIACSKKENTETESNVMLEEPEVTIVESSTTEVATPKTDSLPKAVDSAAASN